MIVQDRLQNLISMTENKCTEWLQKNAVGQMEFVDPIDNVEVSAHYGATHMAAALFLNGHEQTGNELLKSILERWDDSKRLPGFHNDFNNFALCVIYDYAHEEQKKLIENIVLSTPDSNHNTVNWLPMRWAVNQMRYKWTQKEEYNTACENCKRKITQATWSDGFIDDRLPVGLSFNLQYDVATVAVMQYLRVRQNEVNIEKELGALLAAEAPDGDINYLGRGTNQIFAWGLWIYLLASSGQMKALDRAIAYLEKHLPTTLKNKNLILNDIPGEEKYMWWDYHYCSVYTAHLLMWLNLAKKHLKKAIVAPQEYKAGNSGVEIYKTNDAFVVTFNGRKEYLAERGPVLCALWTRKYGMLIKGAFGPWKGAFGNNYLQYEATLRNFAGMLEVKTNSDCSNSRIAKKLNLNKNIQSFEKVHPLFLNFSVRITQEYVEITYEVPERKELLLNLPLLESDIGGQDTVKVKANDENCKVLCSTAIMNQYGWAKLYQSKIVTGGIVKIRIER